jgi:hypothetical protein
VADDVAHSTRAGWEPPAGHRRWLQRPIARAGLHRATTRLTAVRRTEGGRETSLRACRAAEIETASTRTPLAATHALAQATTLSAKGVVTASGLPSGAASPAGLAVGDTDSSRC